MRECLYAMQLRKPLFISLIDDVPLPLLLVDRQFNNFTEDYDEAVARLAEALKVPLANPPKKTEAEPLPETISIDANENNFFAYLAQMENGEPLATVARDLYKWAQSVVSENRIFRGVFVLRYMPRVDVDNKAVTVFSILAYLRHPAVQIPFDYLRKYPPFTTRKKRLDILKQLESLLPKNEGFERERIDRRPAIPLEYLSGDATRLEKFKEIVAHIIAGFKRII